MAKLAKPEKHVKLPIWNASGAIAAIIELIPVNRLHIPRTYFYRESGLQIVINQAESNELRRNPYCYYFSTALKLHLKCQREGVAVD